LELPKKSSTYLSGYASGFFVISALFRQNFQNAHDGTFFHHPANGQNPAVLVDFLQFVYSLEQSPL
jgi:hypothetical protein